MDIPRRSGLALLLVLLARTAADCSPPCANGGVCIGASCHCVAGYHKTACEAPPDPCVDAAPLHVILYVLYVFFSD